MNTPADANLSSPELVHEKYKRRHSFSGMVACGMAGLGLIFGLLGVIGQWIGGRTGLWILAIAWPAMFSFCLIGMGLAIHGVIPQRRRKVYPLLGLAINPLVLVLFMIYFWWPTPDTLVSAAAHHDVPTLNRALRFGVQVDAPSKLPGEDVAQGATALTAASQMGHVDVIELLLARGADVNKRDASDMTPLDHAVAASHTQVVDFLLNHGARADLGGSQGYPVTVAARQGHQAILELLLEHGGHVNPPGRSPLHEAAALGHNGIAARLIEAGAQIDARDDEGRTPLHAAAANGHLHVLKLLLRHQADINASDPKRVTPLDLALEADHTKVVDELIANHARIGIFTAIAMRKIDRVRELLAEEPGVIARRSKGRTPLHEAARLGQRETVTLLLNHDAPVDDWTTDGQKLTPLHLAVMNGHLAVARLLVERGAQVNAIARQEGVVAPPLYFAVMRDHERLASLLLEHGADVNALCETSAATARPLFFAVTRNRTAMIQTLLDFKADIDGRKNNASPTPLYEAVKLGYIDVVALLMQHGADANLPVGEMTPTSLAESRRNRDPMVFDRITGILTGEEKAATVPTTSPDDQP